MPQAINLKRVLSTTQQEVLVANPGRRYALIALLGTDEVFLSLGEPATADRGIPLLTNGANYEINATNLWTGKIYAVAKTGTPALLITEW